ncbi:HAMP domain-containing sensor histidine kinase [Thermomonas sp. HDW16]|uniref:sensor histidine kinase n=1 Tax=Thermomonas sp. HDW16 TaxID=2714945 RepID=UPI00140C393F|nr:HAMP domain-containing sensor histidine kinase [Thermomonas sp. HDW16]QIL19898.1 HAMP domain-containing histidine kinase [Thermomonas sp. HDW16]
MGGIWPRLHSTSARLVLVVAVAFLVAFLLLGAGVYGGVLASLDRDTREFVRSDVDDLLALERNAGRRALLGEIDTRAHDPDRNDLLYAAFDHGGRRTAGLSLAMRSPPRDGWRTFRDTSVPDRPRVIALMVPLADGGHLLAGMRTRAEDGFLASMQRAALLAVLLAALCGLLVGWLTSRWVGARLARLDDATRRITEGELALRVPVDGTGDPFDRIGARLNAMLDRIDSLADGVRHATDHIAHDLRTPLARMRNRLESLRDDPGIDAKGRAGLDTALTESDQMLQTFSALLRLSRIEAQTAETGLPLDLARIVADALELYAPVAAEQGMQLSERIAPAPMRGDADQLFQVVVNLLDNAVRHARAGGEIAVSIDQDADSVMLEVADRGPGVPVAAVGRIFDRFERLEPSRGTPGNGLGLSLVRAIVIRHGGRIELEDNQPGLRVRLRFPAAAEGQSEAS